MYTSKQYNCDWFPEERYDVSANNPQKVGSNGSNSPHGKKQNVYMGLLFVLVEHDLIF